MRNIPVITKNLLIINVLVFVATYALRGLNIDLNTLLGLHFILAPDFRAWQFVTYMFMHGGVTHLLMNMFMLWMFGMVVENVWGPKKFLFLLHGLWSWRWCLPRVGTVWYVCSGRVWRSMKL